MLHARALLLLVLLIGTATIARAVDRPPAWIEDPANSQWILFGGKAGIAETNGLTVRPAGNEGTLTPAERAGAACAQSVIKGATMGYFYLKAAPWDTFRKWLGEDCDLLLTVRYFDGAKGTMAIAYDSSDPRVKHPPYPAGVWKFPPEYPRGVPLKGTKKWITLRTRLPLAFFTKRLHGGDVRIHGRAADFALAGVAVTRVPKGVDLSLMVKQGLRVASWKGGQSFGSGIRFAGTFVQRGDEPIVMEAELATKLSMEEGHAPGVDPDASAGAYIHFVDSGAWTFTVNTPGHYVLWERASFPWGGFWNHTENMDGSQGVWVADNKGAPPKGWKWVKAGAYDLTAGKHTFSTAYQAGARLDVLVLSRDADKAPDLAALKSSYVGPVSGEVVTTPAKPLDVAQWRSVQFDLQARDVKVTYAVSTDEGKTWRPFSPQTDLSKIPCAGGGKDSLAFRLTFAGKPGDAPPLFAGGVLTYLAGPKNVKVVENDRIRLEVDPYGIQRITDKKTGETVSNAPQMHAPAVTLIVKEPGPAPVRTVDLYNCVLEDCTITGGDTLMMTYAHNMSGGGRIRIVMNVKLLPGGQTEWRLLIRNDSPLEVAEIRFPALSGCKLGQSAEDDWMFYAKCWGQVLKNPGAGGPPRTNWGPSMRWTMLWDDKVGLYFGIEDPSFNDYGFLYGADPSGGVTIAPAQRILVRPNGSWQSPTYRIAVTGGDWHEGADVYRDYVAKALKPCDVAPHIKWLVDAWLGQDSNRMPTQGWDVITNTWRRLHECGVLLMPANRQMLDGADSGYCGLFPYPSPVWGSIEEFQQKLAVLKSLGGMYTPYHNFHLWSPGYGHHPRVGTFPKSRLPKDIPIPDDAWYAKAATYTYTGSYPRMEADRFAQLGMAMGSRQWRDWLAYWTARYIGWGTDGMYYDQFNMLYPNGRLYPDFATYGCWAPGTLEVISRMKSAARARDPYYTSSGEVCNDVYGQFVDLHMTSGVFNRLEFYRYCNPDQILIDGAWNGGLATYLGGPARKRFIWQVGARFENFAGPPGSDDGKLLALRRAVKSLLYDARFMDTVGLVIRDARGKVIDVPMGVGGRQNAPVEGAIGRWFLFDKRGQRGAVVNLMNVPVVKRAKCSLSTKDFGPVTFAMAWTLEGKCIPVVGVQQKDTYTFDVPESELSSVVLSGRLCPVVAWNMDNVAAPGVMRRLKLTLTNVNAQPVAGAATLRAPKGWPTPGPIQFGPIAPGDTLTFTVPVDVPRNAPKGRCDVWCDVATDAGDFSTYNFVTVSDAVLLDFRGDPGNYHLWLRNLTTRPVTGAATVTAPKPLAATCPRDVRIPPEAEVRVPVTVTGQAGLREIAEMAATVTLDGRRIDLVRGVIPGVPNGDFETDSAGDMRADWWMARCYRDEWSYEAIGLSKDAHSGKYALRIDPPHGEQRFICAYPVHSVLKPDTLYRISLWIKCKSPKGVHAVILGRRLGEGKTTDQWQKFETEVRTGPRGASLYRTLFNFSPDPALFDDIQIEEVAAKK